MESRRFFSHSHEAVFRDSVSIRKLKFHWKSREFGIVWKAIFLVQDGRFMLPVDLNPDSRLPLFI